MHTLAHTLRLWRQAQQLSQASLACRLGCSPSTIGAYERAQRKTYMPYLQRIAAYLRRPLEHLMPQLLQHCPPEERLLLKGELDYQRQLEQVQANKARQRAHDHACLLDRCGKQLRHAALLQREVLAQCQGELPAPFHPTHNPFCGTPPELLRLQWDKCHLAQRLLYRQRAALELGQANAQMAHRKHTQSALRWQQAFRRVGQLQKAA